MRRTLRLFEQYGLQAHGARGVHPWRQRVEYETFRSKFAPQYKIQPHFHGINPTNGRRYLMIAGLFAIPAGAGLLLFLDAIPKVQKDILQKLPIVGGYFVHEVPPEDNPF